MMSRLPSYRIARTTVICLVALIAGLTAAVAAGQSPVINPSTTDQLVGAAYPTDPTSDIAWSAGYDSLADVATAFNNAHAQENAQLGTFLKPITFPSAATWSSMSGAKRALWLINAERESRGMAPLHGIETNVQSVAQAWAQWLLDNNKFDHEADGRTPWERLHANPSIGACHDTLNVAENLFWKGTTDPAGVPLVIEQAVYNWMYVDRAWAWGHRHAILWNPYTENGGDTTKEGFVGIGHAKGSYITKDRDGNPLRLPYSDMIVMNVFDPCATWLYGPAADPAPPATPVPEPTVAPPPDTRSASGQVTTPAWVDIEAQPFEQGTWPGQWQVSDANGATNGEYMWIPKPCVVLSGALSGWAVGGGADGEVLGCGSHYPNNARSWMIYGPFDLKDALAAELRASVHVYTEPYNDILCLAASLDRQTFNGPCVSGNSSGWVEEVLDLNQVYRMGSLLGRSGIYVALAFITDGQNTRSGGGVFVDDIVLRKGVMPLQPTGLSSASAVGQDLYGVTISDESGRTAMTDSNGNFLLDGLTPGIHTLTAYKEGYQLHPSSIVVDVTASDATGVRFVGTHTPNYRTFVPVVMY